MSFKLRKACPEGRRVGSCKIGQQTGTNKYCKSALIGEANINTLLIILYNPLDGLVHIERAGGHSLEYEGYVEAELTIPDRVDK